MSRKEEYDVNGHLSHLRDKIVFYHFVAGDGLHHTVGVYKDDNNKSCLDLRAQAICQPEDEADFSEETGEKIVTIKILNKLINNDIRAAWHSLDMQAYWQKYHSTELEEIEDKIKTLNKDVVRNSDRLKQLEEICKKYDLSLISIS